MATPQMPSNIPGGSGSFKRMGELERRVALIEQRSPFLGTGLSAPSQGTTQVDGNLVVQGTFTALSKVSADALVNPSAPQAIYDSVNTFAVPTTLTNIKTVTVPVPAGFTTAAVTLCVTAYAINNTAGLDYLYSQANINGYNGWAKPTPATGSGGSCLNTSQFAAVLYGLGGSSVVLQIAVQTSFGAWASSASNIADLSAMIVWYR